MLPDQAADQHHETPTALAGQVLPPQLSRLQTHRASPATGPETAAPDGPHAVSTEPLLQRFQSCTVSIGFKSGEYGGR